MTASAKTTPSVKNSPDTAFTVLPLPRAEKFSDKNKNNFFRAISQVSNGALQINLKLLS